MHCPLHHSMLTFSVFPVLSADLPMILSGRTVAFLDPHKKNIGSETDTGKSRSVPHILKNYPGHATVFDGVLGCKLSAQTPFDGTLFRFPLRSPEAESELSSTPYSADDVKTKLFDSFMSEAAITLLFLKHVSKVELYERGQSDRRERLLMSASIVSDVEFDRRMLASRAKEAKEGRCEQHESLSTVSIQVQRNGRIETHHYRVINYIDMRHPQIRQLANSLNLLPWVGVATPLPESFQPTLYLDGSWPAHPLADTGGQTFCFLPLPTSTGCPVHLHGYFAVADNRRSIKWPSSDEFGDEAQWNKLLVEEVLAQAYASLLKHLAAAIHVKPSPTDHIAAMPPSNYVAYIAWPELGRLRNEKVWASLREPIARFAGDFPLFWTEAGGGQRVSIHEAWFIEGWQPTAEQGFLAATWQLAASFLGSRNQSSDNQEALGIIASTLLRENIPVVLLPPHIQEWLADVQMVFCSTYRQRQVTPSVLRWTVRQMSEASLAYVQNPIRLEHIFHFAVKDNKFNELTDLSLLPMKSGQFCKFSSAQALKGRLYLPTASVPKPSDLFPNLDHLFVDVPVSSSVHEDLMKVAHSGKTNLVALSAGDVPSLLMKSLQTWQQSSYDVVGWQPNTRSSPGKQWLTALWIWMSNHSDAISLSSFSRCHILPLNWDSGGVIRLHRPALSSCIAASRDPRVQRLSCFLQQLGCPVLSGSAPCNTHPYLHTVLFPGTAEGVVDALQSRSKTHDVISDITRLDSNSENRQRLRELLATSSFRPNQCGFVERLPVFEQMDGGYLVSASQGFPLAPSMRLTGNTPRPPNLLANTPESVHLLAKLDITPLSEEGFVVDHLAPYVPVCSRLLRVPLIHLIISRVSDLSRYGQEKLSRLAFVPTCNTSRLSRPADLYDPDEKVINSLFSPADDVFPDRSILSSSHISILRNHLCLRTLSSLTANASQAEEVLLSRARAMSSYCASNGKHRVVDRAKCMLKLLDEVLQRAPPTRSMGDLLRIAWAPVQMTAPADYPPGVRWYGRQCSQLVAPSHVRVTASRGKHGFVSFLVGASRAMVDEDLTVSCTKRAKACAFFGWTNLCSTSEVIQQLILLTQAAERLRHPVSDRSMTDRFRRSVFAIYSFLQANQTTLQSSSFPSKWIWVGHCQFVEPRRVILEKSCELQWVDLRPHRYVLDEALKEQFESLFRRVPQLRATMGNQDVAAILRDIAGRREKLIDPEELDLYCRLIRILKPAFDTMGVKLPLRDGTLLPATKCSYPDQDRFEVLSSGMSSAKLCSYQIVHQSLTKEAPTFGAKKLSSLLAGSKPIRFWQPYGQKDPLTRRIRRILDDYPTGSGILKELVQNADDARASEVRIMVDWRRSGPEHSSRLLDQRLAAWEGPAIWAYNNAVFRDEDFENITQVEGATKLAQTGKIGRFGLGFNAVYHLTDLPSFVSRRFVAFFDPHAQYLPDASPSEPGTKIDFVAKQKELKDVYPDQFQSYQGVFGCKLLDCTDPEGFNGTLFRFPLRTKEIVSDICSTVYTREEVLKLVQAFVDDFDSLLLFLQFVRNVSVYELSETASDPSRPQLLCSCELSTGRILVQHGLTQPKCPTSLLSHVIEKEVSKAGVKRWKASQKMREHNYTASQLPMVMYNATVSISSHQVDRSHLPVQLTSHRQEWLISSGSWWWQCPQVGSFINWATLSLGRSGRPSVWWRVGGY